MHPRLQKKKKKEELANLKCRLMKLHRIAEGSVSCVTFQSNRSQGTKSVLTPKQTVEHNSGITSKQYVKVYNDITCLK